MKPQHSVTELGSRALQGQREVKRVVKREKREQQHREQIMAAEVNAFQFPRLAVGAPLPELCNDCVSRECVASNLHTAA